MDTNRILIAAILFIVAIAGINYAMVVIARSWAKGDSRWMKSLRESLSKPVENASNKSMDELHKKVEEIEAEKRKNM